MLRKTLLLGSLLSCGLWLRAQYFETGVEPFSVKWRQMSTGKIRLIYPSEAESLAPRYLTLLSATDTLLGKSYALGSTKLNVVLHPNTVLSNGFVAWAPRRMELITHPAYESYAQQWSQQLAIHEMRHVKQLYALNRNTVKFASYLLGQQATGLAAGLIPLWYLEGDAVAAETAFSHSGRGRTARFYQHYRAYLLGSSKRYGYDKWLLGSYKHYVPNHYAMGYQLVAYGNLKYGSNMWANTIDYVSRKPHPVFPFYFGLKKQTGLSRKSLYEQAFAYTDSVWRNAEQGQAHDKVNFMDGNRNEYANYLHPYILNDSTVLAYKTSLKDIPAFVAVDTRNGRERVLTHPGSLLGRPFFSDSLIVWAEYKPHVRWEYKSFGQVTIFHIGSSARRSMPHRGMFGSPMVNPANGHVYCIEHLPGGQSRLVSLSGSGGVEPLFPFGYDVAPFELAMGPSGAIYAGVVTPQGKEVWRLERDSSFSRVLGPTFMDINSLHIKGDSLFFAASSSSKEEIYYTNLLNGNTFRVINSTYSLNYFTTRGKSVALSAYTANGYRVGQVERLGQPQAVDTQNPINDSYTSTLSANASLRIDTLGLGSKSYASEPYRGAGTLFNFHSWAPFYFNPNSVSPEELPIKLGATAMSQSLTGSTVLVLGYGYGNSHLFNANIRYSGFWPVFSLGFEQLDTPAQIYRAYPHDVPNRRNRNRLKLYSYLPFTLSSGNYFTYIQLFNSSERTNDYLFDDSILRYKSGLFMISNGLSFRATRNLAHRDLWPRMGIEVTALRVSTPYNRNNIGSLSAFKSTVYLPGMWKNQHLRLRLSAQRQELKHYYLSSRVDAPRGCTLLRSERYGGFSADYLMPMAYPDWAMGSLMYIKRLSLDIFFDYAKNAYPARVSGQEETLHESMRSVGFEVNIDLHLLRTKFPFRIKYQQAFIGSSFSARSSLIVTYNIYDGYSNIAKYVEH